MMPKRTDLSTILLIGSGPIVIGQGAEFDYSGTQAVAGAEGRGLRGHPGQLESRDDHDRSGVRRPDLHRAGDAGVGRAKVIERERPDALLPTMGGQTALNVAMALQRDGVLREVRRRADRRQRARDPDGRGPRGVRRGDAADRAGDAAGRHRATASTRRSRRSRSPAIPAIIRPSFTLGGTGGGIAYNREEFEEIVRRGLELSPVGSVLVERSVIGWKEFELEVMRDGADNVVIVCSIENLDPMGVHTGDSITVAPAMTLTDREYQTMRDAADRDHPRDRRRGRRLQHPVRGQSARRRDARHRDEPARVALVGAGVEGDRIPDRAHRHQARRRLPARRDPQRHHQDHAGLVRAGARLRRGEDPALRVREVPRRRSAAHDADEVGRRVDGDRPHVQGSVPEGTARRSRSDRPGGSIGADAGRRPAAGRSARDAVAARCDSRRRSGSSRSSARFEPAMSVEAIARAHRDRSVVPRSRCASCSRRSANGRRRGRRAGDASDEPAAADEADGLLRPPARRSARRDRGRDPRASDTALGVRPAYKMVDTCAGEFPSATPYLY